MLNIYEDNEQNFVQKTRQLLDNQRWNICNNWLYIGEKSK